MEINDLETKGREIWQNKRMSLDEIVITMGVVYGDICREARRRHEGGVVNDEELQKELGNLIFSCIRWCRDLEYEPEECIALAQKAQAKYASRLGKH